MPPKCAPDHHYCDAGPTSVAPKRWCSRSRVLSRRAIASTGLPRDEVFVTTKLWNLDQGYDETLAAFDRSLSALGMDVRIGPHPDAFETP
jgi:2,5-diketo-D-gluconate reductase A